MARVNIDILGISELKLTGPGEFNSDDHYIYYCGQESLRRNGGGLVANKRVQNAALGCSLINGRMIYLCFQGQSFNITLILVYAPNTTAKDAEVDQLYEDLQDLSLLHFGLDFATVSSILLPPLDSLFPLSIRLAPDL